MKKLFFISAISLCLSLCACGSSSNYDSDNDYSSYNSSYDSSDDYDSHGSSYDSDDYDGYSSSYDSDDYDGYSSSYDSDDDFEGYNYDEDDYYYSSNDKDGNGKLSDEEFQNAMGDYLDDIMGYWSSTETNRIFEWWLKSYKGNALVNWRNDDNITSNMSPDEQAMITKLTATILKNS